SILPRVTTGNTMAPCVVIGEQAAAFLLAVAPGAKSSRSRHAQSVERADDARPIVSRHKRMRERRLGTPAGTMPRRDDTKPDTIGEVVDGRLNPRLHALACQMIAAEDDVDRLAAERAQRPKRLR